MLLIERCADRRLSPILNRPVNLLFRQRKGQAPQDVPVSTPATSFDRIGQDGIVIVIVIRLGIAPSPKEKTGVIAYEVVQPIFNVVSQVCFAEVNRLKQRVVL